jgi:hypothetical protein
MASYVGNVRNVGNVGPTLPTEGAFDRTPENLVFDTYFASSKQLEDCKGRRSNFFGFKSGSIRIFDYYSQKMTERNIHSTAEPGPNRGGIV